MSPVLDGTVLRLRGLRPEYPDAYAVRLGVPAESGWSPVADLTPQVVEDWCAEARERDNPQRLASVAATAVGGALTHAVLGRVTAALLLERRAWDVDAANLAVHRTDGYLDQVAVRGATGLVLPDDPAAGTPGTAVLPDTGALLDRVASRAVATLEPLFQAVRAATRYGVVPLWNGAADAVRSAAAYVPLYAHTDQRAARELGTALVDALVAHGARIRGRAVHEPLLWRDRSYAVPVRAACCLYYKTEPATERPGDEYCMTCPFLCGDDRARRFTSFLDALEPVGTRLTPAPLPVAGR
ncbi:(2Fe-2S)-binding protein [Pseudonocardia nigra]|uniref:(2Fe-2S)-binding protein n=1 Tax=Pseudonocardia nigra TaxID=1921578 RepID=UPI001C60411F|nr:(2Fe-2S)-binding protein [Pseudonocardia nigra]